MHLTQSGMRSDVCNGMPAFCHTEGCTGVTQRTLTLMRDSGEVSLVRTLEAAEEPVSGGILGSQRPVFCHQTVANSELLYYHVSEAP